VEEESKAAPITINQSILPDDKKKPLTKEEAKVN
jgi:hypothetical protein